MRSNQNAGNSEDQQLYGKAGGNGYILVMATRRIHAAIPCRATRHLARWTQLLPTAINYHSKIVPAHRNASLI